MKTLLNHKLFLEIVLLFALAYILVGCGKTSPQPKTEEAASASSGDPARDRMLRQLQEIEAAKKKPQQQNQGAQLPDPTKVKLTK